jgi:hypothetical protein
MIGNRARERYRRDGQTGSNDEKEGLTKLSAAICRLNF